MKLVKLSFCTRRNSKSFANITTELIVLACLLATSAAHSNEIERPDDSFRIIGGSDAQPAEFPHMVAFGLLIGQPQKFRGFCGGSIINKRWILTAAHCVDDLYPKLFTYAVIGGTYDIRNHEKSVQKVRVASFFMHENYNSNEATNDIALIKLKRSLKFNKNVAPISLPKKDMEPTGPVILSGWGRVEDDKNSERPSILQKANLEIIDRKTCNQAVMKVHEERNLTLDHDLVGNEQICSGPLNSIMGGCNGDSGSALIRKGENGTAEVVGIASWVIKPCGSIGAPTVYTRVSMFIDWIENVLANN